MAEAIFIPRLGWNMEEGVFVGWRKQAGDTVQPGDALFALESDKATQDVESLDGGTLWIPPDGPAEGDRLAVGTVIGHLLQPGEAPPPVAASGSLACRSGATAVSAVGDSPRSEDEPCLHTADTAVAPAEPATGPVRATVSGRPTISPRARQLAVTLGIDWTRLHGSGATGRIREKDVRAAAAPVEQPFGAVAASSLRQTIAERMLASARSTAPVTLTSEVDATNLVNLRSQFKAAGGEVPGYTDFLVKLATSALHQHPLLNARWTGEKIETSRAIHIGIAIDTDAGLLVPVIRDAPALSLRQISAKSRDLATRARQRHLRTEEMQGGTFTITNLGAFGIDAFTPIINYPQCAILGVGRIQPRPVAVNGQVVVRERVVLSLTFDHRIVDGAPAARFLQALGRLVENPAPAIVS